MDNADIDTIPVTSLDDEQQNLQHATKAENCNSPNYLTVESTEVTNANDAYSPALQLESSLNESANDSYVQVEGLLKLPQLESTRISITDADLSKVQSESGDSQNPLNAGFVRPYCDNQSSSKLDQNEISVFIESDSDPGHLSQQNDQAEDKNVQPILGTDSDECLDESIHSGNQDQGRESQEPAEIVKETESSVHILPASGLDANVENMNDSVLSSISENQELNQHVLAEDSILPVSERDSSVEILMDFSIPPNINQESHEVVPENGMIEEDSLPEDNILEVSSMEVLMDSSIPPNINQEISLQEDNILEDKELNIVNEITVLKSQEPLNAGKSSSINNEAEEQSDNVKTIDSVEVHLNDETTNSDPEVEQVMKLPDTVSQLTSKDGVKVYLVGTAHFSLESQEDVAKTILMTRPRVVVVELCVSRLNILRFDEKTILDEAKNLNMEKVRSTIKQYGAVQGALYLLFLSTSAHLTRQLGMAPGGEFRRAYNEGRNVQGCRIHLGDRPIHVTLHRALAALSLWQKAKLVWHLLLNRGPISAEEVERCKQKDLLEEMLEEMTGEFPPLSRVFVQERDLCLAHSLQLAAADAASEARSNSQLNEPPTVVGVVGIGHIAGISRYFGKVSESDVRNVMSIPPQTMASRVFVVSFKLSVLGLVCYGCYKVIPKVLPSRLNAIDLSSIRQYIFTH